MLPACSVVPSYTAPNFPFAQTFAGHRAAAPTLLQDSAWWRQFDDPVLVQLIDTALSDSLDLELARERVVEARALARAVPGGLSSNGTVSVEAQGGSDRDFGPAVESGFGLSWLFDPYGGRAAQQAAAAARVDASDAERDAAQLLLLSDLANTYVELRFAEASLQLRQQELQSRRRNLGLVRQLVEAKTATQLDLVSAQAQIAQTQALIPPLQAAVRSRTYEIAVLLGQPPGVSRMPPGGVGRQPVARLSPEIGIPTDLLRNRPDIRIAERLYYAAISDIGAARADLYPTLSLGGTITIASINGATQNAYGFGPSLTLPALPNGARRATVELRESRARQAHTTWKSTVLAAIGDVESGLVEYGASREAAQAAQKAVRLYARTVGLTRELIASDGASVRDLLAAEQAASEARIRVAEALRSQARHFVALNVSLGSGNRFRAQGAVSGG